MSLTLRKPYPMVAPSKDASGCGSASASPCCHEMGDRLYPAGCSVSLVAATLSCAAAKSKPTTSPLGPTASARRSAKSPEPQHTSMARSPFLTPVHFTAARFQTRCKPSDKTSLSWSYTGAMSLNSSWRSSAAAELYCSSGRPVMNFFSFSGRREGDDVVVSAVVSAAVSTVVAAPASIGGTAEVTEPFFASSAGFEKTGEGIAGTHGVGG